MYTPTYQKPYPNGYQNTPNLTTPIMAAFLNNIDSIIGVIEDYLADNPILDLTDIAPAYDNTSTYAVDDIVSYQGKIYQCNTTISTAEEFDSTKWTEISLGDVYASKAIYTDTGIHMGSGSFSETGSGIGSGNTVLSDYGFAAGYGNALYAGATDSVALGRYCTIDLYGSVAIGNSTNLHGTDDFGIGYNHDVQGSYSGAIGMNVTIDSGHSIGIGNDLLVGPSYQTVLGNFNVKDTNNLYALIVGIGTSDNSRRNGLTLSKSGDLQVGGDVVTGSGNSLNKAAEDFLYYENNGFLSKNLIPMTIEKLKAWNTSGTWNDNVYTYRDVEFTVNTNKDGAIISIIANGTASGSSTMRVMDTVPENWNGYILSGCPSGGSVSTYRIQLYDATDGVSYNDTGSEVAIGATDGNLIRAIVRVEDGYTATNLIFRPMIRSSRITDSTFMPYSPSNDDLDETKADKTSIAPNESGNTVASQAYAVGEYFYKDGYFCEVTTAIASGATLTENTNYTKSNVADALKNKFVFENPATGITAATNVSIDYSTYSKVGHIAILALALTVSDNISAGTDLVLNLPYPLYPISGYIASAYFADTSGSPYRLTIVRSGNINRLKTYNAISSGIQIRGTITFIAD